MKEMPEKAETGEPPAAGHRDPGSTAALSFHANAVPPQSAASAAAASQNG